VPSSRSGFSADRIFAVALVNGYNVEAPADPGDDELDELDILVDRLGDDITEKCALRIHWPFRDLVIDIFLDQSRNPVKLPALFSLRGSFPP
jgi:hypothetical protein